MSDHWVSFSLAACLTAQTFHAYLEANPIKFYGTE